MPQIKITLTDELAAQLESDTLESGQSRHQILEDILTTHYSNPILPISQTDLERDLIDSLKRENEILREHVRLLEGVSALIMTGQLRPAAEVKSARNSGVNRLKRWLREVFFKA